MPVSVLLCGQPSPQFVFGGSAPGADHLAVNGYGWRTHNARGHHGFEVGHFFHRGVAARALHDFPHKGFRLLATRAAGAKNFDKHEKILSKVTKGTLDRR